jgi:transcriptional regulator GlxA family with amidase domain
VITLLERVCDEEISLQFAARVAHLGKRHFVRLFKYYIGMSFKAFVTKLRVQVAATILVEEPFETVTQVAFRAGPWDLSTFERAFRKVMGVSPRQYRERNLPREEA